MLREAFSPSRRHRLLNCSPAVRNSTVVYLRTLSQQSTLRWLRPALRLDESDTGNPSQPPPDNIAFDDPGGSDTGNPSQPPPDNLAFDDPGGSDTGSNNQPPPNKP